MTPQKKTTIKKPSLISVKKGESKFHEKQRK